MPILIIALVALLLFFVMGVMLVIAMWAEKPKKPTPAPIRGSEKSAVGNEQRPAA